MRSSTMTKSLLAITAAALSLAAVAETPATAEAEAKAQGAGAGAGWLLQRYDADGDGMITLQEFQAAGDAMFARLDLDGDGRLSADELRAAREAMGRPGREGRADREGRPHRDGNAHRDGGGHFGPRGGHTGPHGLARLDADGDGYVSKAEFDDARLARFSALDVNGNGVIEADELPQRRARGEGRGYGKRDFSRSK